MRIFLIAASLLVVILLLIGLRLSATEFGIAMLGGALVVAVVMFFITRRRYQRMTDAEKDEREPPTLP
ncbi:hypothetical protein NO932_09565 [Pelagibacterium sp. 26DY04]|uniref:hypothetical protein n=1 Tax=Pelagibacterium sp. 26DY04 TaxID=2967130 RepID=UPI002815B723|nr:hypothetical protein [Pelagibacterium sp. 26DY04]WMT85201.1 hypothetical protein NO932_09565 [Pelagibacterium sp. 26DY04]